ncbi:TPA: hypothetical protein N0F65_004322 [Lagenidium giganteum]|uniref:C2 domain-containing protein n=1 Tax=Lagenidium giganteum TaxID=4803 RepID=A0AAV2ZH44_9STRA|nr:TPA: hypothetical protein N0F65_004322 [Lagenidium giganteum]
MESYTAAIGQNSEVAARESAEINIWEMTTAMLAPATAVAPQERLHLAPFLYEKHVNHQDGVAGNISIRLVEARNLRAAASMFWVRTCNPYVIFRIGKTSVRSTTIQANDNPCWRKEVLDIQIPKIDMKRAPLEDHSNVRLELIVDAMNEDSLTGKATECVGMANGSLIGTATVDVTPLVEGKEEVMDRWVTLSSGACAAGTPGQGKQKDVVLGEVRIILQYEAHGMEPAVGDIVKMEGFGAYPSALLPPIADLEMQVKRISGSYLLCSHITKSGFEGMVRLHRNAVFVAHRGSLLDRLYVSLIATPLEYVGNTPLGKSCREVLRPYVNVAMTFSLPAIMATRATVTTTLRASNAAVRAVLARAHSTMETMAAVSLNDVRSPSDRKNYRLLTLANGLEALLIQVERSDADSAAEPESEPICTPRNSYSKDSSGSFDEDQDDEDAEAPVSRHAAACLTVGVGGMSDPENLRGLAHYLEHMLFMGSAKYPDENEFEAFLSTHGGYSNGSTECEVTRFLFEVSPQFLQPALDMFAQFFIAPLFKREALERELLAVESEFNRAMQNDYVRLQQIQCETCAPGHPYNTFSWGNTESLATIPQSNGVDVRDAMIAFYEQHYSANVMKLCVCGEDSLDDMQKWVTDSFSKIPRRDGVTVRTYDSIPRPFGVSAQQQPMLVKILPVRKMHAMHLYWTLPPLLTSYRQKPWEYLSHALGHEGAGSLTAILKDKHWATQVAAGVAESDSYEFGSFGTLFEVNVSLTRRGIENWSSVAQLVFDFVAFLRKDGLHDWIFDELKASSEMLFQFQEEQEAITLCRRLSGLMQSRHAVERTDLLRYDTMQGEFDEPLTRQLLDEMTPQNTRVLLLSHSFEDALEDVRTERWFGAKYSVSDIPAELLDQWSESKPSVELLGPTPNPFMTLNFTVNPPNPDDSIDVNALPTLLFQSSMTKLWYKKDVRFNIPKANVHLLLCLPSLTASVTNYVFAKIYIKMVNDALKHVQYLANIANLEFELFIRDLDIEVTVSGFSSKLPELTRVVCQALLSTPIDTSTFVLMKDELTKEYRNINIRPASKARYMRLQLLERITFPIEDIVAVLASVTLDEMVLFHDTVLWNCAVTMRSLIHGNLTREAASKLVQEVEASIDDTCRRMPPLSPQRPHTTELPLTSNGILLRDMSEHDDEPNSMVEVYYQIGRCDHTEQAYLELLNQLMHEPLFHHLRTLQQLGYEVYCCVRDTHGVLGFSVSVQSASHPAGEIALCIDRFIYEDFAQILTDMDGETFLKHVQTLQRFKLRQDTNLTDETYRYWDEIQNRRYQFDIQAQLVRALDDCTLGKLRALFERWMIAEDGTRKLRVHVVGKSSQFVPLEQLVGEDDAPLIVDNVREYKKALKCHC